MLPTPDSASHPTSLPDWLPFDEMLSQVLQVSLTGVVFYLPLYDPAGTGEVVDFAFARLNPAAQRMLRLPEVPAATSTFLQQFPETLTNGSFAFHRDTFLSGQPNQFEQYYRAGDYDNYFRVAARRTGPGLLVSFTDTGDQSRSPAEEALREAQTRQQAELSETALQRQQLYDVLHQAPVAIALLHGPTYVIEVANPRVCEIWTRPLQELLGRPLLEALPELQGQGVDTLLDSVLYSGEPYVGTELPFVLQRHGHPETIYFNFIYQPQRNAQGATTGVLVAATDVTAVVRARQQMEAKERETAELNEELAAANEEIRSNNDELTRSQLDLLHLNQDLEARVAQRTQDLQQAQQEAERQKQRLERLFMQAPAAICILDGPDLVYELVNPSYQALFPGRLLLGRPILEALPELNDQPVWHTLRQVYETGTTHQETAMWIPVAKHEGAPLQNFCFNYVQQARYNETGRVNGVVVFAFDVTAQEQAQQAAAANARQLQLLTDALPVLIGYLDREQRYRFANKGYQTWFNQNPADLLGQKVRDVVGEAAYRGIQGYIARALAGEQLDFEADMPYRADFVRRIRTSYVPDIQQGEVQGFYTLVTDITEQATARAQVQRLNDELASINEELAAINEEMQATNEELLHTNNQLTRTNVDLDNFIYSASHDLKAPISNIEGLLSLLREELPAEVVSSEYVGPTLVRMLDSVERFKRTIDHLTEVSKLQKEYAPATTAVDLAAVLEDVRLDLTPQLREANANLAIDIAGLPPIMFPEKNLRSVVYNLLSNALKYRSPDRRPHIDFRGHVISGFTVLEVHDNGMGIDATHQPMLFNMFQRFHSHVEGTGIGLYMVKRMVDNAGGHIKVHSQVGTGTTFYIYLPHVAA